MDIGSVSAQGAKENISFKTSLEEALKDAQYVQESGPENIDFKAKLFTEMDKLCKHNTILASSSSGLMSSAIQVR